MNITPAQVQATLAEAHKELDAIRDDGFPGRELASDIADFRAAVAAARADNDRPTEDDTVEVLGYAEEFVATYPGAEYLAADGSLA